MLHNFIPLQKHDNSSQPKVFTYLQFRRLFLTAAARCFMCIYKQPYPLGVSRSSFLKVYSPLSPPPAAPLWNASLFTRSQKASRHRGTRSERITSARQRPLLENRQTLLRIFHRMAVACRFQSLSTGQQRRRWQMHSRIEFEINRCIKLQLLYQTGEKGFPVISIKEIR